MKKTISFIGKVMLAVLFVLSAFAAHSQQFHKDYQDGKIWFKLKDNYLLVKHAVIGESVVENPWNVPLNTLPFVQNLASTYQITLLQRPFFAAKNSPELQRTYELHFADYQNVETIIKDLIKTGAVEYAEKVPNDQLFLTPNDPQYNGSNQWGLFKILAGQAWDISTGSASIKVATVDNAIQTNHADLQPAMWVNPGETAGNGIDDDGNGYIDDVNGYDVADNDNNPNPLNSSWDHGTHVAGTTGAKSNNGTGVASIGYGISIVAVKATKNSSSPSSVTDGYAGITYAVAAGCKVINCSWGGTGFSQTGQNVINNAWNNGCIVVAAAGNNNVQTQFYPAAYTNCFSVASTTSTDTKSGFSNYGTWVDISAPGSNILSTVPFGNYAYMSGTSMASPLVSGLLGLMYSYNPGMSKTDVLNCVTSTAVNIDGLNPGYAGKLGAGRINAFAAMQCVSGTLNQPPVADFTSNVTTVTAGGSVNFTDLSYNNPTTWSWNFGGGGTPNTSSQKNPTIQFNTPGTYTVTLTATNGNGNDVETKTNYITVTPNTGCDTVTNIQPGDNIYIWSFSGNGGYIGGHNNQSVTRWAEYITGFSPNTHVQGAYFYIPKAKVNGVGNVTFRLYNNNGPGGAPGTTIATKVMAIADIVPNITQNGFYPTYVHFNAPVAVPNSFYIGYEIVNASGDTITTALTQNLNPGPRPNTLWMYNLGGNATWQNAELVFGGAPKWNMHVYILGTTLPVTANITPVTATVCQDSTLTLSGSTSVNAATYKWYFNGSTFQTQSTQMSPAVTYNIPGTHKQYLIAYNSCGFGQLDSSTVTVNPKPTVNVSAANDTICKGLSTTLSASGNASTYTWDNGLPNGVGPHTVSPTNSTTYTVTGTNGQGCKNSSSVTITVQDVPQAAASYNPTNICENQPVVFDGSNSVDANTFSWVFSGGSPATSSLPFESVTYATVGTYNYTLVTSNNCGNDTASGSVNVVSCVGVNEWNVNNAITSFYNQQGELVIRFNNALAGNYTVNLMNSMGQLVVSTVLSIDNSTMVKHVNIGNLSNGAYHVVIVGNEDMYTNKFVKF
ncbi:MAG: S8 family serine peptidase [Bacteroidetes bacterium]|nr:PKD domain-containing protein [Bacteroidota bacterium]MCL4817006.1 S8 family serine peptidase [Flavobacteriales bacterium]NOG94685.1 S8 family serine peptidase [Bacteroidota bacterium]WKZ74373.1 MAG: S8 family serine peptidase [Vicingaceae bacterium]